MGLLRRLTLTIRTLQKENRKMENDTSTLDTTEQTTAEETPATVLLEAAKALSTAASSPLGVRQSDIDAAIAAMATAADQLNSKANPPTVDTEDSSPTT
jgi:hypothetical protein